MLAGLKSNQPSSVAQRNTLDPAGVADDAPGARVAS
jgi:hypothetical protein